MNMKTLKTVAIIIIQILIIFSDLKASDNDEEIINWHAYHWLSVEDYGNLNNPRGIICTNVLVEGISSLKCFQISLDIQYSYIYDDGMDILLWRNPGLENQMLNLQAAGKSRTKVLQEANISIDNNNIGFADLRVINRQNDSEDAEVSGFLGYEFFSSTNKILLLDQPGARWAITEKIPESWNDRAHFTSMNATPNHLSIQVTANDRRLNLAFDPSPKPALILYRNRDYRRVVSKVNATDSLIYYPPRIRENLKLAGKAPAADIYFGRYKLKNHDVYLMPEREHRRGKRNGLITMPFFEDYIVIIDFKNNRFGIIPPAFAD